jgi:hypothetical protein
MMDVMVEFSAACYIRRAARAPSPGSGRRRRMMGLLFGVNLAG